MNSAFMTIIKLSSDDFRRDYPRLIAEHPGAEVHIVDGKGRLLSRLILGAGPKPTGWPEGAPLVGEGLSLSEYVIEQRD